ncbi:MAG: T9SS type A sorting domain-containing protein [Bacteroidetes bacterium]|nr:T9SS type A sorting domain-containing protein [Bacteroidota bacterium]
MKNYTRIAFLFLLLCSVNTFAAGKHQRGARTTTKSAARHGVINPNSSLSNTIFYSEDFASGLPLTWQAVDNAGNGINWSYTTTGITNQGSYGMYDSLSTLNTTAANGYMIYDSDASNGGVGGEDADLLTGPIDCSTYSNVHLYYIETLLHYAESATVSVSTDGTNWTQVYDASAGLNQDQGTANPNPVDLDITSLAAGQAAVYVKFNFTGDYDYFWMIDDFAMYQVDGTDASLSSLIAPATTCSLLSNAETVTVSIFNAGGTDFNIYDINYIIDGNAPVTESVNGTVIAGGSLNYDFVTLADLSAPGTHTITCYISLIGDTNQTNDTITGTIFVGPHALAVGSPYVNGFELTDDLSGWTVEDLNNDTASWDLTDVLPHSGTYCARMAAATAEDYIYTTCLDLSDTAHYDLSYYYRNTSTSNQANFEVVIGQAQNSSAMTQVIVPMSLVTNIAYLPGAAQFQVSASGTYYIGFHVVNGDSLVNFRLDDINISQNSGVGIVELGAGKTSVYPNPSTGSFMITSTVNSESFLVSVSNMLGQEVYSRHFSALSGERIDLSSQSAGQYIVRIITDKGVSTQSVNISR